MKRLKFTFATLSVLVITALTVQAFSKQGIMVKATDHLRASLSKSAKIEIYEGLPHQRWERETLEKEKLRPDTTKISSHPFYIPKVEATPELAAELKKLLSSTSSYREFSGEKLCGGFHPDYAVAWTKANKEYTILLCFGCSEALFVNGKKTYRLDFTATEKAQQLLKSFELKRPKSPLK